MCRAVALSSTLSSCWACAHYHSSSNGRSRRYFAPSLLTAGQNLVMMWSLVPHRQQQCWARRDVHSNVSQPQEHQPSRLSDQIFDDLDHLTVRNILRAQLPPEWSVRCCQGRTSPACSSQWLAFQASIEWYWSKKVAQFQHLQGQLDHSSQHSRCVVVLIAGWGSIQHLTWLGNYKTT